MAFFPHPYPSAWAAHQANACHLGCWYCEDRRGANWRWHVRIIPSENYAAYVEKCRRLGVKTL